ncbi:MAG TPA: glycosyltransferase [Bryobacteraceae bacterium]|nr:glycosyltransferase [Bryobacteraceae bacterium]
MDYTEAIDTEGVAAVPPSSRVKVLHVGKFYPPQMGGIETHLEALCGELKKSLSVRVIVASDNAHGSEEVLRGIPVSRLPTPLSLASTPLCPRMMGEIRRANADIIHLHLPNPMAILAYLASGHRGHLVVTYHSDTVRQKALGALFEPLLHLALRRSAAIIATSPDYQRTSIVLQRYSDRCHVIPYGIALRQFEHCDASEVQKIRAQYGERLVISVGRLVYYKGFEYLIQAMREVNGKLLIAGEGPLRRKLQELANHLGVTDKVVFLGEIQNRDVIPYYHAADLFALASVARSEAFGIVQIEAMAAGLPIVNTKLDSGVPFVSPHRETGLTVPPRDAPALARAVNHLLDNPRLRQSLGGAGRLRAQQEFSVTTMAARTLELYSSVMKRSDRRPPRS